MVTRAAGARKARQKKEAVCNRVDQSCRCIDAGAFGCGVQPDFVKVDFDLPRYPVLLSFKSVKVLVIGGGGREHALVWRLKQSPSVSRVFAAPGNPGIAKIAQCILSTDYLRIAEEFDIDCWSGGISCAVEVYLLGIRKATTAANKVPASVKTLIKFLWSRTL